MVLPNGLEIELLFDKGKLAYTFTYEEQVYGNAVKLPSKSVADIASASMILFTNAIETYENLTKK